METMSYAFQIGVDNSSLSNGELQPSQSNFIIGRRNSKYMLALSVLCQKEDTNSHSYNSREAEQPQQLLSNLLMGSKHFIRPLANMNRSSDLSDKCNAPHYENIANSDDNQDSEEGTLKDAYEARCRVLNSGEWKNYNVRNYVRQVKKSIEIPIIRHIEIEVCNKNLENEGKEKNNLNTESTNPIGNIQSSIKDRHSQIDNRPHVWQATSIDCSSLAGTLDDVSSVLDQSPYESLESGKGEELNENSTKKLRQTRSLTSIDELANKKRTQVRKKSKSKNRPKKDAPVHRQIEQHTNDSDPDWCFDLIGPSSESETSTTSSPFDNALTAVDDVFVKGKKCIERSSKSDRVRLLSSMEPKIETTKKAVVDSAIISAKVSIESQATVKSNKTLTSKSSPSSSLKDTKPCFVTLPSNVTVNAGETARFVCYAVGDPHPTVRWFLNTVLLKEDGRVRIGNTGFDHFLEIDDVVADESGKVKCMLDNSSGSREAQVDLYVKSIVEKAPIVSAANNKDLAPKILTPIKNINLNEGECIRLKCKIFGNDFDIRWYHNGMVLARSDNVDIDYRDGCAILQIKRVSLNDTGVLTCLVSNTYGEDKSSAIIRVAKQPAVACRRHGTKDVSIPNYPNLLVRRV